MLAQAVITVPEANITASSIYGPVNAQYGIANAIFLIGGITVKSSTATLPATVPGPGGFVPLSSIQMQVSKIGNLALLSVSPQITLTNMEQPIYAVVLGLGEGAMFIDFNISTNPNGWVAGSYSTPLVFTGIKIPTQVPITITIPAFITPVLPVIPITTMSVTDASFFNTTSGGINKDNSFDYYTTLPTLLNISSSSKFSYTTTYTFPLSPQPNSNLLTATLTDNLTGPLVSLSTTSTPLTSSSLAVIPTNKRTIKTKFSLTGAQLKSDFVQAGTYKLPITYSLYKNPASYSQTTVDPSTITSEVDVVVSPFFNIVAQNLNVSLSFNTAEKYKTGATSTVSKQLLVNSTVPYTVTVKSISSSFSSSTPGNTTTIPLHVLSIKEGNSTPITLSTTPATIVSGGSPKIGAELDMTYSIPATKTSQLIGKPASTYTASIIYTITGP